MRLRHSSRRGPLSNPAPPTAGLIALTAGLITIALGAAFPSSDPLVALGWLFVLPSVACCVDAALLCAMMIRGMRATRPRAGVLRIVACAALAGLALAFAFGTAGVLSQIPDAVAGLNGDFVPGAGAAVLLLGAVGASAGLLIGGVCAAVWWLTRGRYAIRESISAA